MIELLKSDDDRVRLMAATSSSSAPGAGRSRSNSAKDGEEPLRDLKLQAALEAEKLTERELNAIAELASARLEAIDAREAREAGADSDGTS